MKRTLACLLWIAVSSTAFAQGARTVEDGSWWKSLTPTFKLGYISGYARGTELANVGNSVGCLALWSELKVIKAAYTLEQWKPLCLPAHDFDGVKMGQFLDGVDAFYSDFRNQKIEFGSALEHVRDEIKGKPRPELDANLAHLRKCYADMAACVADKQ
jgi:hypothetical protein